MSNLPPSNLSRPLVLISSADVEKSGTTVLHAIDWQLFPGQHAGIVGGNGSGKTTFLELIAGRSWPAPGRGSRIYDFGAGPRRDAVQARQRVHLFGHELQNRYTRNRWNFLALDVVLSGLARADVPQRGMTVRDRQRALELLTTVGLERLGSRRFLTLSRGEQRRVLLARAIGFAPTVLLLDEAASGLDSESRRALDDTIERISDEITIVAAAHRAEDLPRVVRHVTRIERGRLVSELQAPNLERTTADRRARPLDRDEVPLIEVEHASIWLGGREILCEIDWQLKRGEHWLVTGRNGSGKSTLLRLLHGQLRPAVGGRISWPGLGNPRNIWDLRRRVAYVSAEYQAGYGYPSTVAECIGSGIDSSVGLTRVLTDAERQRVDNMLGEFKLTELKDRPLKSLSYGQMHGALIARMLINRPDVLLLDEPWEGLDDSSIALISERLLQAMLHGTQIVCASHIGGGSLPFTDGLKIEDGRLMHVDVSA